MALISMGQCGIRLSGKEWKKANTRILMSINISAGHWSSFVGILFWCSAFYSHFLWWSHHWHMRYTYWQVHCPNWKYHRIGQPWYHPFFGKNIVVETFMQLKNMWICALWQYGSLYLGFLWVHIWGASFPMERYGGLLSHPFDYFTNFL